MIMSPHETPRTPSKRRADFWIALVFAIAANLVFLGLLVFSVSWRNPPPVPVTAELYTPEIRPTPKPPEPAPPPPEPVVAPPKPVAPPPEVKPPVTPDPNIALQKKKEEERRKKEAEEEARKKKEAEEKARQEKLEKEKRERVEKERLEREKKEKEEKERKEAEQRRLAAEKKAKEEAERRAAAEQKGREEAEARARAAANQQALDRWIQSIRIKVTGNVSLPPDIQGNPEAVFRVVQLPTGEIIDVRLQKTSGNAAYDDAVYRAILKSSPLPKPERADLFQRELILRFRPRD